MAIIFVCIAYVWFLHLIPWSKKAWSLSRFHMVDSSFWSWATSVTYSTVPEIATMLPLARCRNLTLNQVKKQRVLDLKNATQICYSLFHTHNWLSAQTYAIPNIIIIYIIDNIMVNLYTEISRFLMTSKPFF